MDNNEARKAILSAMMRADIDANTLEKKGVMSKSTFYARLKNMRRMRLSDLEMIDELAPLSDDEILILFGRKEY